MWVRKGTEKGEKEKERDVKREIKGTASALVQRAEGAHE